MREPSPKPGTIPIFLSCCLRGIARNELQRPIPNFGAVASCKNFVPSTSLCLNLLVFHRLCVTLSPPEGRMSALARCRALPGYPAGCEPLGPGAAPRVRSLLPRVRPAAVCVGLCVWWHWCLNSSRTELCLPQHSLRGGCWQVAPRQLNGVSSTNKHARPSPAPRRGELCATSRAYLALLRAAHTRR